MSSQRILSQRPSPLLPRPRPSLWHACCVYRPKTVHVTFSDALETHPDRRKADKKSVQMKRFEKVSYALLNNRVLHGKSTTEAKEW